MFFFIPQLLPLGLTSADYSAFSPELTYEEKCNRVCEEFRKDLRRYFKEKGENQPIPLQCNDDIIILWRNVPDPTSGKVPINKTLELLCQLESRCGKLYIHSIYDVIEAVGVEDLIHAITLLSKRQGDYIFLDDEFFSIRNPEERLDFNNLEESMHKWAETKTKANLLPRLAAEVVSHLDSLMRKPEPEPIDNFLDIYWKWQTAQVSVEVCKEQLGITHRTFYKYSQAYETTPYYCEHLKLFHFQVLEVAKRGPLPDKEEYLKDMYALELGQISKKDMCKKYGLASEIDIHRVELALTKRRRKAK